MTDTTYVEAWKRSYDECRKQLDQIDFDNVASDLEEHMALVREIDSQTYPNAQKCETSRDIQRNLKNALRMAVATFKTKFGRQPTEIHAPYEAVVALEAVCLRLYELGGTPSLTSDGSVMFRGIPVTWNRDDSRHITLT